MSTKESGKFGENAACEYLKNIGCKILELNYSKRTGEIDIIARDGEYLVFAEVKARKSRKFMDPCEAVNHAKQVHIRNTAELYLSEKGYDDAVRFDVIEVIFEDAEEGFKVCEINHIKDAF